MKHFLLSLIALCCTLTCSALTFQYDGLTYSYKSGQKTCLLYSVPTDYEGALVVPREVEYKGMVYKVTGIGAKACQKRAGLTQVELHDGITAVESYAFAGCTALTKANIPGSVLSCKSSIFDGCSALTDVTLGEGTETLGAYMFGDCTALEHINLPESITTIGKFAFYNCAKLTDVKLPSGLTGISESMFSICASLTEIYIPASVMSIGSYAFAACDNLRAIHVDPANADYASLDGVVFSKDMTTLVLYPAGRPDESYSVPAGVTDLNPISIQGSEKLKHLILPEGLKNLRTQAITASFALESVALPASLENYEPGAIYNCEALSTLTLASGSQHYTLLDGVLFDKPMKTLLLSPALRPATRYEVPDGVEHLAPLAFFMNINLIDLKMPASVTQIEEGVFDFCVNLQNVVLSPNITVLPENAFYACEKLEHISLPEGLTAIEDFAFLQSGLKELTIPAGVRSIGTFALGAEDLKQISSYAPEPPKASNDIFYGYTPELHVIKGLADAYRAAPGWSKLTIVDDLEGPASIGCIQADAAPMGVYDLLGHRATGTSKGLYIEGRRKVVH